MPRSTNCREPGHPGRRLVGIARSVRTRADSVPGCTAYPPGPRIDCCFPDVTTHNRSPGTRSAKTRWLECQQGVLPWNSGVKCQGETQQRRHSGNEPQDPPTASSGNAMSLRQLGDRRGGVFPTGTGFVAIKLDGVVCAALLQEEHKKPISILICHGLACLRKAGSSRESTDFVVIHRD